jgi:hypothetical protein
MFTDEIYKQHIINFEILDSKGYLKDVNNDLQTFI